MKFISSLFLLLLFLPASAQKDTRQVIQAQGINRIVLASDEIYRVSIKTVPGEEIKIFSETDGEYFNEISLDSKTRDNTLYLSSRYREILQSGYDKLSAHKVFSMEVELEIPEGMIVEVNSNVASTFLTGSYERVLIQLKTGSCYLENFDGNAVINTYDGNIQGSAHSINIEANSRHGEVNVPGNSHGIHKLVLTSINGDIKLSETK